MKNLLGNGLVLSGLGAAMMAAVIGLIVLKPTAHAQVTAPLVTQINASDAFPDIVNGVPSAQSLYAPAALLGNYGFTLAGNNTENVLIGGDFGTNLFQDGATVSTITTTPTYVADQWAAFSGTSTTIGGAKETSASDIPSTAFSAALRITRSGAGVIQSCIAQEIATPDSYRFQGNTAEVDFHALAGSGFSAANSVLNVLIVTGTGSDEGMTNLAHSINSALGGSNWTGVATVTVPVTINTAWNRYTVVAPIPATATEIGLALCWTPVGASPTNDYVDFAGIQLTRNSALASVAGSAGAALAANDVRAKSFTRRLTEDEYKLQYAFYWRQNEAASDTTYYGTCQATGSTTANCLMTFPVPMYKAPTISYTAGNISGSFGSSQALEAISALAVTKASTFTANLAATTSSASAGQTGFLQGGNSTGGGKIAFSARF